MPRCCRVSRHTCLAGTRCSPTTRRSRPTPHTVPRHMRCKMSPQCGSGRCRPHTHCTVYGLCCSGSDPPDRRCTWSPPGCHRRTARPRTQCSPSSQTHPPSSTCRDCTPRTRSRLCCRHRSCPRHTVCTAWRSHSRSGPPRTGCTAWPGCCPDRPALRCSPHTAVRRRHCTAPPSKRCMASQPDDRRRRAPQHTLCMWMHPVRCTIQGHTVCMMFVRSC